jgi:hypothetical protein
MINEKPMVNKKICHVQKSKAPVAMTTGTAIMTTLLILASAIIASPLLLPNALNAQAQTANQGLALLFPPSVFNSIRSQPSYVVNIPFSSEGKAVFQSKEASIPTGMTVIWFNSDEGQHTVTTK